MQNLVNVEDFLKIPQLISTINQLKEEVELLKIKALPIDTKNRVALFFGKSTNTIDEWIRQGKLKEGEHFYRKNDKMLVFIEDAILKFAKNRHRK